MHLERSGLSFVQRNWDNYDQKNLIFVSSNPDENRIRFPHGTNLDNYYYNKLLDNLWHKIVWSEQWEFIVKTVGRYNILKGNLIHTVSKCYAKHCTGQDRPLHLPQFCIGHTVSNKRKWSGLSRGSIGWKLSNRQNTAPLSRNVTQLLRVFYKEASLGDKSETAALQNIPEGLKM